MRVFTLFSQLSRSIKRINNKLDIDSIHPVGEVFITTNASFDPNVSWGGTWSLLSDTFLVGAGGDYTIGNTGGSKTHTMTVNEMPSHTHSTWYATSSGNKPWGFNYTTNNTSNVSQQVSNSSGVENTGGGQPFSILPPYTAVNMWLRTA